MDDLVETGASHMHRLLVGCLACLGAVVALTALSLLLGGAKANAAEKPSGLLDDLVSTATAVVTDVVDEVAVPTATTATKTVARTVNKVTKPVLKTVAAVPVVGKSSAAAVGGVAGTTIDSASGTVASVAQTLGDEPIDRVVDPLLGSLEQLPVVGSVVDGLSPTIASGVKGVDAILGSVGALTVTTVDPITSIQLPSDPFDPATPQTGDPVAPETIAMVSADRGASTPPTATHLAALFPPAAAVSENSGGSLGGDAPFGPDAPPGAPPGPSSTAPASSASGGGSGASAAVVAGTDPFSLRAWERAAGAHDDALPSSPVFDTDVSPD